MQEPPLSQSRVACPRISWFLITEWAADAETSVAYKALHSNQYDESYTLFWWKMDIAASISLLN